jgi:translation elongation factor P/translation initiation factor 5A
MAAADVRKGMIVERDNRLFECMESMSHKTGRGKASTKMELRDLLSRKRTSVSLRTAEKVEVKETESRDVRFVGVDFDEAKRKLNAVLFADEFDDECVYRVDIVDEHLVPYLSEEMDDIALVFVDERVVDVKLPRRVSCRVVQSDERDSQKGGSMRCMLDNGRVVLTARHVKVGDTVTIELPSEEYIGKE